jgi:hypothetical protein
MNLAVHHQVALEMVAPFKQINDVLTLMAWSTARNITTRK